MWQAVYAMDGATILLVAAKAFASLASLAAAGSVLVLVALTTLDHDTHQALRRLTLAAALAAALASLALIPASAAFLAGGAWTGAVDPVLTGMMAHGPLGESLALRLAGLVLVALVLVDRRPARIVAALGAVAVCVSFALRGHVLMIGPRPVGEALLSVHLLGLAFWIGAFAPLHRIAGHASAIRTGLAADEFGRKALWTVAGLAAAGGVMLVMLTGGPQHALGTPYGKLLALKLAIVVLLLGVAAFNRFRFVPALLAGDTGAALRLRRSITIEVVAVAAILATTATLTTITSPERPG